MCANCNEKKDKNHIEEIAEKVANATNIPQQVYSHTTYEGEIFDFERLGIKRENIVSITKIKDGKYFAISLNK